jgi:AcrR family transcriptional regulator
MTDTEYDTALVTAAMRMAGEHGWRRINAADAAREAGLSLAEARARFPSRASILLRFGRLADQAALFDAPTEGTVRDKLFDLLMRRFDVLQTNRSGVKALLRFLPTHPPTALLLASATRRSMRWMLQAAGVPATGPRGEVQIRGLMAVWLWGVRAWERDESEDLSGTMAAVDNALQRAERLASWLDGQRSIAPPPPPAAPGDGEWDPSAPPSDVVPTDEILAADGPTPETPTAETPTSDTPTPDTPTHDTHAAERPAADHPSSGEPSSDESAPKEPPFPESEA